MSTSGTIAILALAVSLISFWLSYRNARFTKNLAAAEKRTETRAILVEVLLEVNELLSLVRTATNYKGTDVVFPNGLEKVEKELAEMASKIPKRLVWLRDSGKTDPVKLEEYKSYALEVESGIKRVGPMIRDYNVHVKEVE